MRGTLIYAEKKQGSGGKTYWRVGIRPEDGGEAKFVNVYTRPPAKGARVELTDGKLVELPQERVTRHETSDRDRKSINKAVALKEAAGVVAHVYAGKGREVNLDTLKAMTLALAEAFEAWLERAQDEEAVPF